MNNLPVQMHPRYQEFLAFMTECPHRKTPSTMETAFWAWSKKMSELCGERWLETGSPFISDLERIDALKKDLDRKHRECAERERQVLMLAEDNERLQDELKNIKATIERFLNGGAVGERGGACMSIDGSNL